MVSVWIQSVIVMMALEDVTVKFQTRTSVNIGPVIYLPIVQILLAAFNVPVFLDIAEMVSTVKISMNARIQRWLGVALRTPNVATCHRTSCANARLVTLATAKCTARMSTSVRYQAHAATIPNATTYLAITPARVKMHSREIRTTIASTSMSANTKVLAARTHYA
jgi:hypothetical protein